MRVMGGSWIYSTEIASTGKKAKLAVDPPSEAGSPCSGTLQESQASCRLHLGDDAEEGFKESNIFSKADMMGGTAGSLPRGDQATQRERSLDLLVTLNTGSNTELLGRQPASATPTIS